MGKQALVDYLHVIATITLIWWDGSFEGTNNALTKSKMICYTKVRNELISNKMFTSNSNVALIFALNQIAESVSQVNLLF